MLDIPVLAADHYVENFSHTSPLPSELLWKRWQLLPLCSGSAPGAVMGLRASNHIHTCRILSDHLAALVFSAVTPLDEFKDPVLPAVAGGTYRVLMENEDGVLTVSAVPDPMGWQLVRCDPTGMELCASLETLCVDVQRWSQAMRTMEPLTAATHLLWRFMEPPAQGGPLRWRGVRPQPASWSVAWEEAQGGVVLRCVSPAEHAAESDAMRTQARRLRSVRVTGAPPSVTLQPAEEDAHAMVRVLQEEGADTFALVLVPLSDAEDAPDMRAWRWPAARWCLLAAPQGGLTIRRAEPRNDVVAVTGSDLRVAPACVRPPLGSDACWANIPLCHLRRGDCVRAEVTASLTVGAVHSRVRGGGQTLTQIS